MNAVMQYRIIGDGGRVLAVNLSLQEAKEKFQGDERSERIEARSMAIVYGNWGEINKHCYVKEN
jgi:hypothetical protein